MIRTEHSPQTQCGSIWTFKRLEWKQMNLDSYDAWRVQEEHGKSRPKLLLLCLCLWLQRSPTMHRLTFNAEFKADVAEGQSPSFCFLFADTADVVIIQINTDKCLLFIHVCPVDNKRAWRWNTQNLKNIPYYELILNNRLLRNVRRSNVLWDDT